MTLSNRENLHQGESFSEELQQNKHIEHLEDSIWQGTVADAHRVLDGACDMIATGVAQDITMTIKYDGAPAVFFGEDEHGVFFVSTKAIFSRTPTKLTSLAQIREFCGDKPQLAAKLTEAFETLSQTKRNGVYQGDLLYTSSDLFECGIRKGAVVESKKTHIGFAPNTITYLVKKESSTAAEIAKSRIGLIIHTGYKRVERNGGIHLTTTPMVNHYKLPDGVRSPKLPVDPVRSLPSFCRVDDIVKKEQMMVANKVGEIMAHLPYIEARKVQTAINKGIREEQVTYRKTAIAKKTFVEHWKTLVIAFYEKQERAMQKKIDTRNEKLGYKKKANQSDLDTGLHAIVEKEEERTPHDKSQQETQEIAQTGGANEDRSRHSKDTKQLPLKQGTAAWKKTVGEKAVREEQLKNTLRRKKNDIAYIVHNKKNLGEGLKVRYEMQKKKDAVIAALNKITPQEIQSFLPSITGPMGGEGYVVTLPTGDLVKLVKRSVFSKTNFLAEKNRMLNGKTVFVFYGRMNPPTKAHAMVAKEGKKMAEMHNADFRVYVTRTNEWIHNPLPSSLKKEILEEALQRDNIDIHLVNEANGNLIQLVHDLAVEGYRNIVLVGGSDRVDLMDEASKEAKEIGSKLFYKVVGSTRSDLLGVVDSSIAQEDISATRVRKAARSSDWDLFVSLLPEGISEEKKLEARKAIRGGMFS